MFQRHLHFSLIADIAEGRVSPDDETFAHLSGCSTCASNLAWLSRVIGLLRADTSEEPGAVAVGAVKALFRAQRPQRSILSDLITAVARFDSARMAPAFGLRSGGTSERQFLFVAGPFDIDLRVAPAGDRWSVSGQILGDVLPNKGRVAALGPAGAAETAISAACEFALEPLRPGRYNLAIHLTAQTIVIPNVELGA